MGTVESPRGLDFLPVICRQRPFPLRRISNPATSLLSVSFEFKNDEDIGHILQNYAILKQG